MTDTPAFLSQRLLADGDKSIDFFTALSAEQLDQTIYTEGTHWTARQVLAHYVATEHSLCRLVENIASGGAGASVDFDVDRYNERKVKELSEATIAELLEKFRQNRIKTVEVVAGLKQEDLERQGRHPFLGIVPLAEIIKIIYRHNQIHQREIRQALKDNPSDIPGHS
jgi:hypothetical protein